MRITPAVALVAALLAPTSYAQATLNPISDGTTQPVRMENPGMSRTAMDMQGNLWTLLYKRGRQRIGAGGCALFQDTSIIIGYMTDASGAFRLTGTIPGTATAAAIRFQSGVIEASANTAGIVFTRTMSIHP